MHAHPNSIVIIKYSYSVELTSGKSTCWKGVPITSLCLYYMNACSSLSLPKLLLLFVGPDCCVFLKEGGLIFIISYVIFPVQIPILYVVFVDVQVNMLPNLFG